MAANQNDITHVRISQDNMRAYLYLVMPQAGSKYTRRELIKLLNDNRVTSGINEETLDYMIEYDVYGREVQVAEGKDAVNGTDGYYEYYFNRVLDKKPAIKDDGTVDYWSISSIENVTKDQVIATYIPAVQGEGGFDVKGKFIAPKRAKELLPLKGKGFVRLEDDLTYVSTMDGKIEFSNDRITISEVYELFGNADLSTGNINFSGDVIIHGNVCNGITIDVGGTLTVDGYVEAAKITAGKDIILRGGMQGGNKASIYSKGNITAKFFENTEIEADGIIEADIVMNSTITKCDKLILNGKKATILGGKINAIRGVDSVRIGNESEVATEINVGISPELFMARDLLKKKIERAENNIERINIGLKQFAEIMAKDDRIKPDDPRKAQLLRAKIQDTALMNKDKVELQKLEALIDRGKDAYVRVGGNIFPRVKITIDDVAYQETSKQLAVEFVKIGNEVVSRDITVQYE